MKPLSKYKDVKSTNHTWYEGSIIKRYIVSNPDLMKLIKS